MSITYHALRRGALLGALTASVLFPALSQAAEVHHQGDVSYVCGGVGEEALRDLQAQAPKYNMGFWMVEGPQGEYLADVPIRILHKGKTVAEFKADGPLCYVKAPAGNYTIVGTHKGQQRRVDVHTGNKNVYLRW